MKKCKWFAVVLFMIILVTGCDRSGSGSAAVSGNSRNTGNNVLRDGKVTELRVAFPGVSSAPERLAEVEAGINEIISEHMDATVKLDILEWGVFADQQNLILSSGEDVALMFTYNGTKNYATRGQVYDITEFLDQYAGNAMALLSPYLEACKIDGALYGLPTFHEYTQGSGLIARTDLLNEMHVKPEEIQTWDDVDDLLGMVREKYPNMNVLCPADGTYGIFGYMMMNRCDELTDGVGIVIGDGNTKAVNLFGTDMYREFAEEAYEWNQKGYVISDATTITETRAELLAAGNTFGYIGLIHPGTATQELKNANVEMTTMTIEEGILVTDTVQFAQYMVPSSCKTPEKAVKLLDLMLTDPDINNLLGFGIEGKDYVIKDAENNIIGYPEGVDSRSVGWNNETWLMGNGSLGYIWESDSADIWEQYKRMNERAVPSPLYGFTFDPGNAKNEITAVSNVISKYRLIIEAGYVEPDEALDAMVRELEAAGIQNIVDDVQSQIDEWLQNK